MIARTAIATSRTPLWRCAIPSRMALSQTAYNGTPQSKLTISRWSKPELSLMEKR